MTVRNMVELPYNSYSRYLRRVYGCSIYRVSVDGGFSCPNREDRSRPGCSYCAEDGARAPYLGNAGSLRRQVETGIRFLRRRYAAKAFILYFQAFSATNAPAGELARIYDSALALASFRELVVSTRPDCIDEEKAALLGSYRGRGLDVWVELGLQSSNDLTLCRIGRGHSASDFTAAFDRVRRHGVKVAVHLILGLPGEEISDIERTARFVARLDPDGVKIHNLHIQMGAPLAEEFLKGEVGAPSAQRHLEYAIAVLQILPPRCLIMRLTCDTPRQRLLAPRFFWDKQRFASRLAAEMRERGTSQGRLWRGQTGLPEAGRAGASDPPSFPAP